MKHFLILTWLLIASLVTLQAQDLMRLGYCEHQIASANGQGSDRAGQISAAIYLPQSRLQSLAGNAISRIDVGLISRINVRDLTVWVRQSLDGDNLASATIARGAVGWNEIELTSPYTIPAQGNGLYVGYTYSNGGSSHPVSFVGEGLSGTSFFRSSADASWQDMASVGCLSLEAIVMGNALPQYDLALNAAVVSPSLTEVQHAYCVSGEVSNMALRDVSGFTLSVSCDTTRVGHISVPVIVRSGMSASFSATFTAPVRLGGQCSVTIETLNDGQDADLGNNTVIAPVAYRRNVLVEEFTTQSCPNCPAGAETLHSVLSAKPEYADRVMAVCHHAGFGTDDFTKPCDTELLYLFNDGGQTFAPAFMFNREPMFDSPIIEGNRDNVTPRDTKAAFMTYVDDLLGSPAHAAVGISIVKTEPTADGIVVTLSVRAEHDGRYTAAHPCLTLYTTEDNVTAYQSGDGGYITDYQHQHVIRSCNSAWGDAISWADGQWSRTYTVTLADSWKKSDLRFVAVLANYDSSNNLNNRVENVASIAYTATTEGGDDPVVDDGQPITQTPDGSPLAEMLWHSKACRPKDGRAEWVTVDGLVPTIVTQGRRMYIYCPITQLAEIAKAWSEGEVTDSSRVTFHTPQPYLINNDGTMLYATRINSATGRIEEGKTDLVFDYTDGNLTQTDGGMLAITDLAGNFYGYGDMDIAITRIEQQRVVLPADAQVLSYRLTYSRNDATGLQQTARVAFVGKEVYISNPVGGDDSWMCGTLADGVITVPAGQYLGADSGYLLYVSGHDATFSYEAATGKFTSLQPLLIKSADGAASANYDYMHYEPWQMTPATPATPAISSYVDLTGYESFGLYGCLFGFTIPSVDVDGQFIAPEALTYQLAFDGKPIELYGTTDIPYYGAFEDNALKTYLQCNGDEHQLQTPQRPVQTISVQSTYTVGNDVRRSAKMIYYIADGSTVIEDDDSPEPELAVEPLLSTRWAQDAPYNRLCPEVGFWGSKAETGCIATAMAQIMNYHRYPDASIGDGAYSVEGGNLRKAATHTTFAWDAMKDSYKGGYTSAEETAVAQLMRDCGYAAHMAYAAQGSGTTPFDAGYGLSHNMQYDSLAMRVCRRMYYSDDEWMQLVNCELRAHRPILYYAIDPSLQMGHAFVLDGLDDTGRAHINWGWAGDADGYYDVRSRQGLTPSYLNPYTGAQVAYNFSDDHMMVIGIEPPSEATAQRQYQSFFGMEQRDRMWFEDDKLMIEQTPMFNFTHLTFSGMLGTVILGEDGHAVVLPFFYSAWEGGIPIMSGIMPTEEYYASATLCDTDGKTPRPDGRYYIYLCSWSVEEIAQHSDPQYIRFPQNLAAEGEPNYSIWEAQIVNGHWDAASMHLATDLPADIRQVEVNRQSDGLTYVFDLQGRLLYRGNDFDPSMLHTTSPVIIRQGAKANTVVHRAPATF